MSWERTKQKCRYKNYCTAHSTDETIACDLQLCVVQVDKCLKRSRIACVEQTMSEKLCHPCYICLQVVRSQMINVRAMCRCGFNSVYWLQEVARMDVSQGRDYHGVASVTTTIITTSWRTSGTMTHTACHEVVVFALFFTQKFLSDLYIKLQGIFLMMLVRLRHVHREP